MWRKRVRAERKESRCGAIHDLQHGRRPAQAFLEDLRVGPRFLSRTQTLDAGEITRPSPPRMIRSHSIWMKMPRATRCSAALRRADGIRRRSRCGSFREYTDRRRRHRHERRTRVAEADAFRRYASGRKRNSGDSAVAFASRSRQRDLAQHHAQLSISESSTSRRL